mmetsp:Transcript_31551/g.90562  ORF Transcript_31551/g.90562 Transcript_31551/m.90562 type:complete len:226 (-) Transcript_31551:289-966(-)
MQNMCSVRRVTRILVSAQLEQLPAQALVRNARRVQDRWGAVAVASGDAAARLQQRHRELHLARATLQLEGRHESSAAPAVDSVQVTASWRTQHALQHLDLAALHREQQERLAVRSPGVGVRAHVQQMLQQLLVCAPHGNRQRRLCAAAVQPVHVRAAGDKRLGKRAGPRGGLASGAQRRQPAHGARRVHELPGQVGGLWGGGLVGGHVRQQHLDAGKVIGRHSNV